MSTLLTKENIAILIACVSLVFSISIFVYNLITQRSNIVIQIYGVRSCADVIMFDMSFVNKSRLPILITRISLDYMGKIIDCEAISTKTAEYTNSQGLEVISRREEYSKAFPIALTSLGGDYGIILFENVQEPLEDSTTHLTFLIGTNRGKIIQMKLELPPGWVETRKGWIR